jgi:hypothetical protein
MEYAAEEEELESGLTRTELQSLKLASSPKKKTLKRLYLLGERVVFLLRLMHIFFLA